MSFMLLFVLFERLIKCEDSQGDRVFDTKKYKAKVFSFGYSTFSQVLIWNMIRLEHKFLEKIIFP